MSKKVNILENIINDSLKISSITEDEKKEIIKMINYYYMSLDNVQELVKKAWDKAETLGRGSVRFVKTKNGYKKNYARTRVFYERKKFIEENFK